MSPHIESGEECMQAQNETDYQDKFGSQCAAEVSMEIILLERMRVEEALSARDAVVQRLAEACASISQKTGTIKRLEGEKENLEKQFTALNAAKQVADNVPSSWIDKKKLVAEIGRLAGMFKHLQHQILTLKRNPNNHGQELDSSVLSDVENDSKGVKYDWERSIQKLLLLTDDHAPSRVFRDVSNDTVKSLSPILAESMTFNSPESPQLDDLNMRNLMLNDVDDTKHEVGLNFGTFSAQTSLSEGRFNLSRPSKED
ncbi:hypothetical protein AcV5_005572 [Taiwanofungus camphoratus]|nr:hypothetical protein AcV5_005572 [Antrodia cinnamomea]